MTPFLAWSATAVAVLVALAGLASTLARRRIGLLHLAGAALLEVLLVVQAAVATAALAGGQRPPETATFVGYLAGVVLLPVAGVLWSRTEPSRWAGTVLAVASLVTAVMIWRLVQLWEAPGA
ncbi:hypothetical protein JD79_01390 [Geodermatophilus normandii]|jgi:hypothetical protein|uniref:Integral membrane protein n=1 Tax=Geodermatophilus normandii TaxID=1137989 RepID=A0A317QGP3_9ACTN|nr:hypothetical protein [Geodermatophilus normandii]PWW22239.1 hypothetical protein JD79_01390 [Geodermatophilus normandii]